MIPNYKRPTIREYIEDVSSMTDQDLDMIDYVENLEVYKKMWEELSKRAYITREFVRGPKEMNNKLLELMQELEIEHGIGVE